MSELYEYHGLISVEDVDGNGICKASALLMHLQRTATEVSEAFGFDRDTLVEHYGAVWMLARLRYRLDRPLCWGDALTVRTWHRGVKGALLHRDYELEVNGQPVGEAIGGWVLVHEKSRMLLRLSGKPELEANYGGARCKITRLNKLRCPESMTAVERRRMRYSDMDINGHVNNTRYADFVCDALEMEKLEQQGLALLELQLGYLAECLPGEELLLETGTDESGSKFVRGLDKEGKSRFEACALFGENPFLTTEMRKR